MNFKKIASLLLVLALAMVSTGAFATTTDDTAKIAEYEDRIAELEAQVADLERQLEIQNYVVTFDGGYVTADDAVERYDYVEYMYESYGYSMDGYEDQVKQDIMTSLAQDAIVDYKAEELGLATPDADKDAELKQAATDDFNEYIDSYRTNFEADGATEEQIIADTTAYLEGYGLTVDTLYQDQLKAYAKERLFAYVADEVTITDDDVAAEYDTLVANDQASYESNPYSYESAAASGADIYWNPEGYRAVKQVLIAFSDEQATRYSDITSRISALEDELAALNATPAPAETEAAAEATDEENATDEDTAEADPATEEAGETEAAVEATDEENATAEDTAEADTATEEAAEPVDATEAPRSAALINADIEAANAELDTLYEELMPTANDVVDLFNTGTGIDELISIYGGDPGMTTEPTMSTGYAVSENSEAWDAAFTQAAMSIEKIGELSEPARGASGIYIVYYLSDITPGEVDYETAKDEVRATLLETKQSEAYDAQLAAWMEELNVTYYLDNFR